MSTPTYEEREQIVKEVFGGFPMRIVFALSRDKDGSYSIQFHKNKSKIKIENYKLASLKRFSLDGSVSTPLKVMDVGSFDELEDKLNKLSEFWVDKEGDE